MATIELRHVWKKYGDVEAVRDLSLTCRDGEFLCLLGPSGCGKSSTMRMVAGLEKITAGDLLMDGRRVNDIPTRDRDIGFDSEVYTLYVDPSFYGRGAGRQLLSGAFAQLRKRGFRACVIWAHARNNARFFYEAKGGRLVAERTAKMMGDAVPEVAFGWKTLTLAERKSMAR